MTAGEEAMNGLELQRTFVDPDVGASGRPEVDVDRDHHHEFFA